MDGDAEGTTGRRTPRLAALVTHRHMITRSALAARYREHTGSGGPGATPALTRALERIGWRSVREPTPEELAAYLVLLLDECVSGHGDVSVLQLGIARVFREVGPLLDGGLPPAEAYLPAAEALLTHYVRDTGLETLSEPAMPDLRLDLER